MHNNTVNQRYNSLALFFSVCIPIWQKIWTAGTIRCNSGNLHVQHNLPVLDAYVGDITMHNATCFPYGFTQPPNPCAQTSHPEPVYMESCPEDGNNKLWQMDWFDTSKWLFTTEHWSLKKGIKNCKGLKMIQAHRLIAFFKVHVVVSTEKSKEFSLTFSNSY